ncbi:potassium voltage-gated channel subfamily C member 1 [Hydra vulgaris]|uniref:potassium voltage-gated channel subfamily C member 1 n=1 Tax=Hydra vulgaris TaxID=6087 RepID=UPI001F5FDC78|nr:potassium voltage-gated channel subfamily C member 1 [Hydra vulgaris]
MDNKNQYFTEQTETLKSTNNKIKKDVIHENICEVFLNNLQQPDSYFESLFVESDNIHSKNDVIHSKSEVIHSKSDAIHSDVMHLKPVITQVNSSPFSVSKINLNLSNLVSLEEIKNSNLKKSNSKENEIQFKLLSKEIEQIKLLLNELFSERNKEIVTTRDVGTITVDQVKDTKTRIKINIGGVTHETYRSTLKNIPDTRLSWIAEESAIQSPEYDPVAGEFFVDRNSHVFSHILNYYRTGYLHVPYDVCGPLYEEELQYWGIDDSQIEPCCWLNYRQHRDAQETLKEFQGLDIEDNCDDEFEFDLVRHGYKFEESTGINQSLSIFQKWQPFMWRFFEGPYLSRKSKMCAGISIILIIFSVLMYCIETMKIFSDNTSKNVLLILEGLCVLYFTTEFLLRFLFCPNKFSFIKGIMNWIDLFSIIPFYLQLILGNYTRIHSFLQLLRIIRVFRIIKLAKHSIGLQILGHTLKASFRQLLLLIFFLAINIVIFSSLVYNCEKDEPDTGFNSIPSTFWWAVITMTTVGYGDMVPKTWLGKTIGGLCAVSGVLMIALPVPVIVNNFNLFYSHAQARLKLPKKKRRMLCGAANVLKSNRIAPHQTFRDEKLFSQIELPSSEDDHGSVAKSKSPSSICKKHSNVLKDTNCVNAEKNEFYSPLFTYPRSTLPVIENS